MRKRFIGAMCAYLVLAVMAALTLDGMLRAAVWIFLAGLAARTAIAFKAGWTMGEEEVRSQKSKVRSQGPEVRS
jgi:hypothetical protein